MRRQLPLAILSFAALASILPAAGSPLRLQVAQAPDAASPPADVVPPPEAPAEQKAAPPPQAQQPPPPAAAPREPGERRARRNREGSEGAPNAAPAAPSPEQAQQRGDRRRGRERPDDAPPAASPPPQARESAPPVPPPAAQTEERPSRADRGRRGAEDAPPVEQPPAPQAQPTPPSPRAQPTSPQQAQPSNAPAAPPAARARDEERRGERGKRRGNQPAEQAPQQAQPSPPPAMPPQPAVVTPPPPPATPVGKQQAGPAPTSIEEVKKRRRQRVEEGGKRTIIEEPGRTIVQDKGMRPVIRADETERMRRTSRDVRSEKRPDGGNVTIAVRPGGIEVFSEFDQSGGLTRRYRRGRDGRETNLIDNRSFRRGAPVRIDLGPLTLRMPRERYIVNYERASDADIYDALTAGPVERLPRGYSLDEVRYNTYLRDRMRRIDLDTVTFDFGAWRVNPDQYRQLDRVAAAINRALDRHPDEVFLIEGHTDAVGSDIDNLTLSDRRAEEVAIILSDTFGIPPENLVTQGYGEEFLKVPTLQAERVNRRVAVRRITPLLARDR